MSQHQSLPSCRETLNAVPSYLSPLWILSKVYFTATFTSCFTLRYISVKVFLMCFAVTEKGTEVIRDKHHIYTTLYVHLLQLETSAGNMCSLTTHSHSHTDVLYTAKSLCFSEAVAPLRFELSVHYQQCHVLLAQIKCAVTVCVAGHQDGTTVLQISLFMRDIISESQCPSNGTQGLSF